MKFSYSAVWDGTVQLLRAHGSLIAALAGVFIFLPALFVGHFLPQPQPEDPARLVPVMTEYLRENWAWILLENLLNMVGVIAILRLVFPRGPSTVGAVIAAAFMLLPFYFLTAVISGFLIGIGFVLLIIPGLYLFGRLAPVGAIMVAEERRNPFDAIARCFALTKGRGWAVLGMVFLVAVAGLILMVVVNNILGLVFIVVAGRDVGLLLSLIVTCATAATFTAIVTLLYASIYRHLVAGEAATASGDFAR